MNACRNCAIVASRLDRVRFINLLIFGHSDIIRISFPSFQVLNLPTIGLNIYMSNPVHQGPLSFRVKWASKSKFCDTPDLYLYQPPCSLVISIIINISLWKPLSGLTPTLYYLVKLIMLVILYVFISLRRPVPMDYVQDGVLSWKERLQQRPASKSSASL